MGKYISREKLNALATELARGDVLVSPAAAARILRAVLMDGWPPSHYGTLYIISEIFPDTYSTLTEVPQDVANVEFVDDTAISMFMGCSSLTAIPAPHKTAGVKDMCSMFWGCRSLTAVPEFDMSQASAVLNMFRDCEALTSIAGLDLTSVNSDDAYPDSGFPAYQNARYIFDGCTALRAVTIKNAWPAVKSYLEQTYPNITFTWLQDGNYKQPYKMADLYPATYGEMTAVPDDLGGLAFRDETADYMFCKCQALETMPMINTAGVKSMKKMFYECHALETIAQIDTSSVTCMSSMFNNSHIATLPLLDTSSVTDMSAMFYDCGNLTSVAAIDTSHVVAFGSMFNSCRSLVSLPPLDTSKGVNMRMMFYCCRALASLPELNMASISDVDDTEMINNIFVGCDSLTAVTVRNASDAVKAKLESDYPAIAFTWTSDSGGAVAGRRPFGGLYKMSDIFPDCYETMTSVPNGIGNVEFADGTAEAMFEYCFKLNQIPGLNNTASVTNFEAMFYHCEKLRVAPAMDLSNAEWLYAMFFGCSSLESAPEFNTPRARSFVNMFNGCSSLAAIPLLDMTSVRTDAGYPVEMETASAASYISGIFTNCDELTAVTIKNAWPVVKNALESDYPAITFTWLQDESYKQPYKMCDLYPATYKTMTAVPDALSGLVYRENTAEGMFALCEGLTAVPALRTGGVSSMRMMFWRCGALTQLPELDMAGLTEESAVDGIFEGCVSLATATVCNAKAAIKTKLQNDYPGIAFIWTAD